jgi:hypothetical protein
MQYRPFILIYAAATASMCAQESRIRWSGPEGIGLSVDGFRADLFPKGTPAPATEAATLSVIDSAQQCLASVLSGPLRSTRILKASAISTENEDVVLADFSCRGEGAICLESLGDHTTHVTYRLRSTLPFETWENFVAGLFSWSSNPLAMSGVNAARLGQDAIAGYGRVIQSPTRGGFGLSFFASDKSVFLSIGKNHCLTHYSPGMAFLERRFPPLPEIVEGWDADRLGSEAGVELNRYDFSRERVRFSILFKALAAKSKSASDITRVYQLIDINTPITLLRIRIGLFFGEIFAQPQLTLLLPAVIQDCVELVEERGTTDLQAETYAVLFSLARNRPELDLTQKANLARTGRLIDRTDRRDG